MDDTKRLYHSLSDAIATTTTTTSVQDPNLKDPTTLCETLFTKLNAKFHEFFSALPLRDCDHEAENRSLPPQNSQLWPIVEDLALILRCSLVVLTLPYSDQKFLILKCRYLLRILKAFLSLDDTQLHGNTFLCFRNFLSDVHMELSDSCRPYLCAVLEVFADELLKHQSLRRYLMMADSASANCEKIFVCHIGHVNIVSVLEVISTHFILSVSSEKAFGNFISRLFLHYDDKDSRFPELGVAPSIALLLDPVVHSAPKMFQAHVISLVSAAIGSGSSGLSSEYSASDMGFHLMAFQKSVILYSIHVSSLQKDGFHIKLNCAYDAYLFERGQPTFESYIQKGTRDRLNQVLLKSSISWDSHRCKMSSETKADLLAEYTAFMKGWQFIFADSCRDKAASILDRIIKQTISEDATGDVVYIKKSITAEDICLLASILRLMSVSLIQAIKCISSNGDSGCLKTTGIPSRRDKYDYLISIINHFQQFKFCLPIQTSLHEDLMKSQQGNYNVSKSMLVYFSGLLSLSFSNGLDLLAKGCISVIIALMYMIIFEEGDLAVLGSLRGLPLRSCSSEVSSYKSGEGSGDKQSIYKIAAEFHRIRTRNLRTDFDSVKEGTEDTCNGEMFLHCIIKNPTKLSDYDELADFLECRKGKDYSSWLNRRSKYRKRRYQKITESRKIKKATAWKSVKCQKIGKVLKRR